MFSSYVETHHRFPKIVVSFLEQSSGLIHSCHFVIKDVFTPFAAVEFMILVTYTEGLRLSCAEFEVSLPIHFDQKTDVHNLVEKYFQVSYLLRGVKLLHLQTTKGIQRGVKNNYIKLLRFS